MHLIKVLTYFLPLVLAVLLLVMFVSVNGNSKKMVIDNDAGTDDAIAIFLALLHEKKFGGPNLVALTTANGNTNEDNVNINNQRILRIAQRQDIPIYRGSKKSILFTPETTNYFGLDGMGDQPDNFTDLTPAKELQAVTALIELSKQYEGDLIVFCIGPVTNIALAVTLDPGFLNRIDHLYLGAGHIQSELFVEPEFNTHMDAEAYQIVVQNSTPSKVTVLPFSQVQLHLNISMEWRKTVFGTLDSDIIRAINRYEQQALNKEGSWYNLDPAVIALALNPGLVKEYKYFNNSIGLCGNERGLNTNVEAEVSKANLRTIYSVDQDTYKQYLLDVFTAKK